MKNVDVIRAWKDEEYLKSLTPEQVAALPTNPAGSLDSEQLLQNAVGGKTEVYSSVICLVSMLGIGCDTVITSCSCTTDSCSQCPTNCSCGTTCGYNPATGTCYS